MSRAGKAQIDSKAMNRPTTIGMMMISNECLLA